MTEISDDMFIDDLRNEIAKARAKFPGPNPTIAALTEEVGELAKAMLHIREKKHADWWRVWIVRARDVFAYLRTRGWSRCFVLSRETLSSPGMRFYHHRACLPHVNDNRRRARA